MSKDEITKTDEELTGTFESFDLTQKKVKSIPKVKEVSRTRKTYDLLDDTVKLLDKLKIEAITRTGQAKVPYHDIIDEAIENLAKKRKVNL